MPQALKMSHLQLNDFLHKEFPQSIGEIVEVTPAYTWLRLPVQEEHLRPGGTVSGPTIMTLADIALYIAILARIGPATLVATTDFTCHFLNKPQASTPLLAKATLLKQGKRLIIGEAELFSEGQANPVAHVVASYSVPPQNQN